MRDKENLRERRKKNYLKHKEKYNTLCRIYGKQYRLNNKEKLKQIAHKYYLENKEKILKKTWTYQKENRDKVNLYNRLRYEKWIWTNNKKQNRYKYKKREKEYRKKYYKTEQWIIVRKVNSAKYRTKKKFTQDWTVTKQFIEWLLISQNYKCNLCWCDITIKYHIDHIYPLSKGWLHTANNIQILCEHCNLCKWSKILS